MPEMKCWHHPWISARWNNNKRPTNTLKVRPNLNRNSNFYVLKKFSNQNIQINPDLWTSKTSLSWKIFFFCLVKLLFQLSMNFENYMKEWPFMAYQRFMFDHFPGLWLRWGVHKNLWSVCARVHDWLSKMEKS